MARIRFELAAAGAGVAVARQTSAGWTAEAIRLDGTSVSNR